MTKLSEKRGATYAAIFAAWSAGKTVEELAVRFHISAAHVTRVIETEQAKQDDFILSANAQKKFDAKLHAYKRQLDLEAEFKARQEARKLLDEWHIPDYLKTLRAVETMLKWKRGIMSRAEYRKIIRCLHPDTGGHVTDENRNEAFRLFTQYEAKLVDDQEQADLKRVSTLPQTVAEMMARKRTKTV